MTFLSFPQLIIWPFESLCFKAAQYFESKWFPPTFHFAMKLWYGIEMKNKWRWKGPLEVIWSVLLLKAGPSSNLDQLWSFVSLFKVVFGWSWNIPKDRGFSASLSNRALLFWCLTTFVVKIFFLISSWNFPRCNLCTPQAVLLAWLPDTGPI